MSRMSNFTFNVFMVLNWSILEESEEIFRWRALKTLKVLASKCSLNSSTLKYVEEFSRSDVLSASFILSIRIPSCVLCFFLTVINLRFLPVIVVRKLVLSSFEKGKTLFEHSMQLQEAFSFFRMLYVCVFILLHLIWTQILQVSQHTALWFPATAFSQILQGNVTGVVVLNT